MKNQWYIK